MLILILIVIQYLWDVVFSFEKGLNGQNSLLLRFPPPNKKFPSEKFPIPTGGNFPLPPPTPYHYLENPVRCGVMTHSAKETRQQKSRRGEGFGQNLKKTGGWGGVSNIWEGFHKIGG